MTTSRLTTGTTHPTPATEPVPFITADPEHPGYLIPSPEETAAHQAAEPSTWADPAVIAAVRSVLGPVPSGDVEDDEHEIGIVPARTSTGGHLATCTCDWHAPVRATHDQAADDAAEHDRATAGPAATDAFDSPEFGRVLDAAGRVDDPAAADLDEDDNRDMSATPARVVTADHGQDVRADQVTTDDVLLQGQALTIRRPVTEVEHLDTGSVLIRYSSGYTVRRPDAPIRIQRRARRAPSVVVVRHPRSLPRPLQVLDQVRALITAHPELGTLITALDSDRTTVTAHLHSLTDPADRAAALLAWYYRLAETTVTCTDYRGSASVHIQVTGTLPGTDVVVRAYAAFYAGVRAQVLADTPSVHLLRRIQTAGLVLA